MKVLWSRMRGGVKAACSHMTTALKPRATIWMNLYKSEVIRARTAGRTKPRRKTIIMRYALATKEEDEKETGGAEVSYH